MMTIKQLVEQYDESTSTATVTCKLIGALDGSFSLIDRAATRLDDAYRVPVRIEGFLKLLTDAGLEPRGGGKFTYGGNGIVVGSFARGSGACPIAMVDFNFLEIEVHRSNPIVVIKRGAESVSGTTGLTDS